MSNIFVINIKSRIFIYFIFSKFFCQIIWELDCLSCSECTRGNNFSRIFLYSFIHVIIYFHNFFISFSYAYKIHEKRLLFPSKDFKSQWLTAMEDSNKMLLKTLKKKIKSQVENTKTKCIQNLFLFSVCLFFSKLILIL